jgi:hypothetical protein
MRRAHIPAAALLTVLVWRLFLPGQAAAQYSYKSGIDLVGFTVTVIDQSGKSIADLKPSDFDIREDGVPQTLAYFSPGANEADVPLHNSSSRSWSETIRLLKASDVTVYPIGFMGHQSGPSRFAQQGRLSEMAAVTGGLAFFPGVMKELDAMYRRIADEMHAQYALGYVSTNPAHDGKWRRVIIMVTRPGLSPLVIRTREGYFAASR